MALLQLPVSSNQANYSFKCLLDGIRYTLAFRYNNRAGRWSMDIMTSQGAMLLAGIALIAGVDLLAQFRSRADIPQGNLFTLNLVDENESPGRDDLGTNVLLMYQEAA